MAFKNTNEQSPNTIRTSQSNKTPAHKSDLWNYMEKLADGKARCKSCSKTLSRQNGATTGLRKHFCQVHKIESFRTDSVPKQTAVYQLTTDEKKQINSLILKCIIQDGRSFGDLRCPGIVKVLKHLSPCTKNK